MLLDRTVKHLVFITNCGLDLSPFAGLIPMGKGHLMPRLNAELPSPSEINSIRST